MTIETGERATVRGRFTYACRHSTELIDLPLDPDELEKARDAYQRTLCRECARRAAHGLPVETEARR
jgi:hypothetical protein